MQAAGSVIFRWLNQEKFIISGFTAGLLIVKITANEKKNSLFFVASLGIKNEKSLTLSLELVLWKNKRDCCYF